MTKTLIIAEKPSVASDIAKSLGGFTKEKDFWESDDYVLTSAVGHLLEIKEPEECEVKRGKWTFNHLPVIPPKFDSSPIAKTSSQLRLVTRLIKRKDVGALINACDAGREGELIFRLIAEHAKNKKPIQRLWLQSMTPNAIREGFKNLRSDEEMLPLAEAARSRAEADWLVGINGTRAMTAFNSQNGGFFLTTVGRVQTPTLSIVVEREKQIQNFVPRNYWEVHAAFNCANSSYEGRWINKTFKKDPADAEKTNVRLWTESEAQAIVDACRGKHGIVTEESRPATQISPQLFDLTSLQREANARFGFSAKRTLDAAQRLYEQHKALTYPRTDSRHLPEDYIGPCYQIMGALGGQATYKPFADQVTANKWIHPNRRIFDNKKISDHFAIIPTLQPLKTTREDDQKLYDMVIRRFLAVFFPAAEFQVTTRYTDVGEHRFLSNGRVMTKPGWLAIYGKEAQVSTGKESDKTLVPVNNKENVNTQDVWSKGESTKPPARYTEATLLGAMERAGKLVDDGDLAGAMEGKGLGTPATRAAIIEGLLKEYLTREGRELVPTPKAFQLMTLLNGLGIRELTLPELTGEWEYQLAQMEKGQISRDEFMKRIAGMAENIVGHAKEYDGDTVPGDYATLKTPCPQCGGCVKENYKRFACTSCDFSITKMPGSRMFSIPEVEDLLEKRQIGPLQGFRAKTGFPFAAILKITEDPEKGGLRMEFDFGQPKEDDAEPFDPTGKTPVGACPVCKGNIYDTGMAYQCEHALGKEKTCKFRSGRIILQQEIAPEQMTKLLTEGKTDLLQGFISKRTNRPFKAYLEMGKGGKIGFKFEEAAKKTTKRAASKTTTETAAETAATPAKKPAAKKTTRAKKAQKA